MAIGMFWRDVWLRPKQMGAIAPSGAELAQVMCEAVGLQDGHVIVELGAGTGALTKTIRAMAPTSPLLAFEPGAEMAKHLQEQFPDIRVSTRFAQDLPDELGPWGQTAVDRVVSGLPWTIWPVAEQDHILGNVVKCMKDDGKLVTFTYVHSQVLPGARTLKALLGRHFTTVRRTRVAWRNVPPAFAWVGEGPKRG